MAKCPSEVAFKKNLMRTLPQLKDLSFLDHIGSPYKSKNYPNYNTVFKKNNMTCIHLGDARDLVLFLVLSMAGVKVPERVYSIDRASFS